jgi:hypothetical protein
MTNFNGVPGAKVVNRNNKLGEWLIKPLTFSNDTGTVSLFTVTGDVAVRIVPICKTNVASAAAANIELGVSANSDAMIAATVAANIAANEIWIDPSPDSSIEPLSSLREYMISNGDDVILTLSAQVDSGAINFACWWFPISSDGLVTVA